MSSRAAGRLTSIGFTDVYDYVGSKMDWIGDDLPFEGSLADTARLSTLADRDVPVCALTDTVGDARDRLGAWELAPVVAGAERIVLGLVRADALGPDDRRPVAEVMEEGPSTYRPHVTAREMAERFEKHPEPWVLVTTLSGRLIGVASAAAITAAADR